jgi:hypothetical protein
MRADPSVPIVPPAVTHKTHLQSFYFNLTKPFIRFLKKNAHHVSRGDE